MTNRDLIELNNILENIGKNKEINKSFKFKLISSRIREKIKPIINPLLEAEKDIFMRRNEIIIEFAKKDEEGNFITVDGGSKKSPLINEVLVEDIEGVNSKMEEMGINKDYNDFQEELSREAEIELDFFTEDMFNDTFDVLDDGSVDRLVQIGVIK